MEGTYSRKTCVNERGWVLVVKPLLAVTPTPMQTTSARPQLWMAAGESSCSSSCIHVIYLKLLYFSNYKPIPLRDDKHTANSSQHQFYVREYSEMYTLLY